MLKTHVEPFLRRKRCLTSAIFQQDGAPPHIERSVKEYLTERFPGNKVISRHFDFSWPPRSPDLNPMDFFFWGYLKYLVYCDETFNDIDQLKAKITRCTASLTPDLLARVVESVPLRLQAIIDCHGQHIEKYDCF